MTLTEWLEGQGLEIEEQRRAWVQPSLTPGEFFACLEIGPHGSGVTTYWGRHDTPEGALRGALNAAKLDGGA